MKFNKRVLGFSAAAVGTGVLGGIGVISSMTPLQLQAVGTDLLATLGARSPGERAAGAVTTKSARSAMIPAAAPISRSLPALVAAAPIAAPAVGAPAAAALVPAVVSPATALVPTMLLPAALPVAAAGGSGLGALPLLLPLVPAIGGGGGGGGFPPGGGNIPPGGGNPPPGPAVPEPATWAMMITGFALLGAALRRRRRFGLNQSVRSVGSPEIA